MVAVCLLNHICSDFSALSVSKELLGVALRALGWVGTRHSWDWMTLELFPNNSVEGWPDSKFCVVSLK